MIKQILGKLPRHKPHKSDSYDRDGANAAKTPNSGSPTDSSSTITSPVPDNAQFSNGTKGAADNSDGRAEFFEALPLLREVSGAEKQGLFVRKLRLCCTVFDFAGPYASENMREKDVKRQTLLELVDFVGSYSSKYTESTMEEVVRMVSVNAFRALPPSTHGTSVFDSFDPEEDEPAMEPSWSHLQVVYELFLRFITSSETDAKLAKRFVDHCFILKLIDLFDSEDARERDYLKTILHRIYGKFMVHRPFIRKAIHNVFYRFVFETERHNGIAELLEILGSIINGFALPLKEEHKLFLVRALNPLHKPKCVAMYHRQLSYCITQFVEKDFKLADTVIRGLLKYWPVTNSHKEVLFIGELEEVLDATQPPEFQRCMVPLFRQIGRCLNSSHFQVAERALFFWNNDHIVSLIQQNRDVILPIIFSALENNARGHWNQAVHSLTFNVRKLFMEMDHELFERCKVKFEEEERNSKSMQEKRELTWNRLEVIASAKSMSAEAVLIQHK